MRAAHRVGTPQTREAAVYVVPDGMATADAVQTGPWIPVRWRQVRPLSRRKVRAANHPAAALALALARVQREIRAAFAEVTDFDDGYDAQMAVARRRVAEANLAWDAAVAKYGRRVRR